MAQSTTQWSLYDSLTSSTDSKYGVTDLIHQLIRSSSHDVCTLKRNALAIYKLLSRAGTLYKEITTLIETLETGNVESWDAYDKYTCAITPLEDLLLKIDHLVDMESKAWLPTDTKVADLVFSIQTWQNHRSDLRKLFDFDSKGFYSNPHLQALKNETVDAKPFHFRDDLTYLNALCKGINGFKLTKPPNLLTSAMQEAPKIVPKVDSAIADESMEQAIRSAMLVYGVMVVLKGEKETKECKAHLESRILWNAAKGLLSSVVDHLSRKPTPDATALKTKVDDFITFLQKHAGKIPSSYWELKKAVQNVRRPYHAQTLAAMKQARELADLFSKLPEHDQTSAKVQPFEEAIEAVQQALSAAASAVTSILSIDQQSETLAQTAKAFKNAEEKLQLCFTAYDATKAKLTTQLMKDAKDEDDKYVEEMKKCFKGGPKTRQASRDAEVVVIRMKAGTEESPKSYSVDESTPLSAILWREADSNPTVGLQSSHFKLSPKDDDTVNLGLETTVGAIGLKNQKRTVYLVSK